MARNLDSKKKVPYSIFGTKIEEREDEFHISKLLILYQVLEYKGAFTFPNLMESKFIKTLLIFLVKVEVKSSKF